jgi:hypothetical protein
MGVKTGFRGSRVQACRQAGVQVNYKIKKGKGAKAQIKMKTPRLRDSRVSLGKKSIILKNPPFPPFATGGGD